MQQEYLIDVIKFLHIFYISTGFFILVFNYAASKNMPENALQCIPGVKDQPAGVTMNGAFFKPMVFGIGCLNLSRAMNCKENNEQHHH